ncbi:MAG TPA: hypothetical protein VF480_02030 [Verrucomicrobiae bacterium]
MSTQESQSADSQHDARLTPVLGLIGTFMLCAAALMAHLSPVELKPVAAGLWIFGLVIQAVAFGLAFAGRWAERH